MLNDDKNPQENENDRFMACLKHFNEITTRLIQAAQFTDDERLSGSWLNSIQHRYQASFDLVWRAIERRDTRAFFTRTVESVELIHRTLSDLPCAQRDGGLEDWVQETKADLVALEQLDERGRSILQRLWGGGAQSVRDEHPRSQLTYA